MARMNTALRQWVWSHPRLTAPLRAVWRALPANLKSIDGWSASKRETYRGVFDAAWYLADNPDVAASGMDPLTHYLDTGWREGRDPNPLFDVSWYLSQHPEIGYAHSGTPRALPAMGLAGRMGSPSVV